MGVEGIKLGWTLAKARPEFYLPSLSVICQLEGNNIGLLKCVLHAIAVFFQTRILHLQQLYSHWAHSANYFEQLQHWNEFFCCSRLSIDMYLFSQPLVYALYKLTFTHADVCGLNLSNPPPPPSSSRPSVSLSPSLHVYLSPNEKKYFNNDGRNIYINKKRIKSMKGPRTGDRVPPDACRGNALCLQRPYLHHRQQQFKLQQ